MNLFDKAKKAPKKTKKTADEKRRVVPSNIETEEFLEMVSTLEQITKNEKKLKAKKGLIQREIKDLGKEEFLKMYREDKRYPGSFIMEAETEKGSAEVMYVPTSRYTMVKTEEKATELKEELGDDVVTEETTFSFDNDILNEYSEEISTAIMNADIPKEAKEKLITSEVKYKIKKEVIEDLSVYEDDGKDMEMVLEKVKPVFQLKNATSEMKEEE